jgi:hypothetical protein
MSARRTREVNWHKESIVFHTICQNCFPGIGRLPRIVTSYAIDVGVAQLQGVMNDIPTEDAGASIARRTNKHMSLCMPYRSMNDNALVDLESIVHIFY